MQRVEPAARLVDGLADVVGGKPAFQQVGVLERIVELCVGHGAGIEPAVDHFRHPPVDSSVVRVSEGDLVHGRPVQVDIGQVAPAERFEFRYRPDAHVVAVSIGPDRQRRTPEALSREGPVDVVFEPVAEASVANRFRDPSDRPVQLGHAVTEPAGLDVPGILRVVDQRVAGAPPVRIVVQHTFRAVHEPAFFEQRDEDRVSFLEELPRHGFHRRDKTAIKTHTMQNGQTVLPPQLKVVLSVGRRAVHDPGAFLDGNEVRGPHLTDGALRRQVVEQARIAHAHEVAALDALEGGEVRVTQRGFDKRFGKDERLVPDSCV